MGLRNSKNKRHSYDIAAVVTNQDFTYKKHERSLPKVELPLSEETTESNEPEETTTCAARETKIHETAMAAEAEEVQGPRIPHWVNEINFKNMLLKTYPDIKEVMAFKASPALAAGENYATLMLRINLTAKFQDDTSKDFSYMLKVPHNTKEMQEMLQVLNFFTIENTVYMEVIPELEDMYRQAGVEIKLGAKAYRLELDDSNIHYVLLEDLDVEAFKNANRLECLNMEHTLSVLRKMAQFHAATACLAAKKGPYSSVFSPDMDNEMARVILNQMIMSFKKPFLENLKTYENGEKYYDLMDKFFDNLAELFVHAQKLLPAYFCTLNHGDGWCNNILFKYSDNGHVEETIFVDFQNSRWSSPAMDLYYFIFSSVQIDIKLSQFDYFVRYYHEHLYENLKLLAYPLEIPNLKEFHIQMIDFGVMATMTSFLTLGIVLLEPTDNARFENFMGETEESVKFKNRLYTNERYRKYINEILPWLYNRGFMEINLSDLDNRIAVADKLKELDSKRITKQSINNGHPSSFFCPEWVNESLFLEVVRADNANFQQILKFTVSPATNSGNAVYYTLLQVDIDLELTDHTKHSLSYLLKTPPHGDQAKDMAVGLDGFERESKFYFDIMPQLKNMYKEKAGLDVAFAPKSFKLNSDKITKDVLVLENVRLKNFKTLDRLAGLDMKHVEAVLKKMAEFHAASACLFETTESVPEIYKARNLIDVSSESFIEQYLECLKHYEVSEEYCNKLKNYVNNIPKILTKANYTDNNKFNVLNHANCWTNHVLFQHDNEENILNTYFIDFQLAHYGTPSYDLYHFLLSSPKLELKLQHFDYFVGYYHENLITNLELLKYDRPVPSLRDLEHDLLDNGVWAIYTILCVLPAVFVDSKDKLDLVKVIGSHEDGVALSKQMFLNDYYRSHVESILPWLDNRGLLNLY